MNVHCILDILPVCSYFISVLVSACPIVRPISVVIFSGTVSGQPSTDTGALGYGGSYT